VAYLTHYVLPVYVIGFSSFLFALWHFKNYLLQPGRVTAEQVLYVGFIIGPLLAFVTLWYGNILPAILLHALNNLLAPMT
jgi:membrane protease YdiL (CAAX protease family)